jgi:NitT/TauT family transport system permease protein
MTTTHSLEGEAILERPVSTGGDLEDLDVDSSAFSEGWRLWLLRIGALLVLLALWQFLTGKPGHGFVLLDKFWVSRPTDIIARLGSWIEDGTLWFELEITFREMLFGLLIGSVAAIVLGFVLARNLVLARLIDPFMIAIYSIPKLAMAPLFILWFGIGLEPKVVLVTTVVFFLVFLNTYAGVRDVDTELIDTVRLMGANQREIFTKVILPSASPWIFTGLKLAVPNALIGAIVGEIMASNRGLGYLLMNAQGQFDTAGVMAVVVLLMVMGWLINEGVNRAEGHLLRWKLAGN